MATLGPIVPASPLNADDATYLVFTAAADGEVRSRAMGDTPSDFATMDTLDAFVNWLHNGTDDTITVRLRIVNGATILAAADSGGTFQQFDSKSASGDYTSATQAFTYVNTTADKATWDAATVEVQQGYSQNMGPDNAQLQADYVELNGTYTTSAPTIFPTPVTHCHKGILYRDGANLWGTSLEVDLAADLRAVPECLKSTDEGANWTRPDPHVDNTNGSTGIADMLATARSGNLIAMAWFDTSVNTAYYSVFDISTETWSVEQETIAAGTAVGGSSGGIAIAIRSDNTVVVAFEDDEDVEAYVRSEIAGAGTWGGLISVYTGTAEIHGVDIALADNDDAHITWCGSSGNANVYHRPLLADDTLGTQDTEVVASVGTRLGYSQAEIYHGWIYHVYSDGSNIIQIRRSKVTDPPTWTTVTLATGAAVKGVSAIGMQLFQADGQLIFTWQDVNDDSVLWTRGPFFGIETDTGLTPGTADTHYLVGLAEVDGARLDFKLVNEDDNYADHDAALASGGATGDIPWDSVNEGFPAVYANDGIGRNKTFTMREDTASHPLVLHLIADLDLDSSATLDYRIGIYQSMDGITWWRSELLSVAMNSQGKTTGIGDVDVHYQDDNTVHISGESISDTDVENGDVQYWQYDPLNESYTVEGESASAVINPDPETIVRGRSDGTVVLAYSEGVSGGGQPRFMRYRIRSAGGVWGTENTIHDTGDGNIGVRYYSGALGASDRVHWTYGRFDTDTLHHRSLSSADALDTEGTIVTDANIDIDSHEIIYNGTELGVSVEIPIRDREWYTATSAANPTWSGPTEIDDAAMADLATGSDDIKGIIDVDGNWVALSPRNASPHDVFIDKNSGGGGWGTDTDTGINTLANLEYFLADRYNWWLDDNGNYQIWWAETIFNTQARIQVDSVAFGVTQTISVAGSTTPTGTIGKSIAKTLTGSTSPAGALARAISKTFSGNVTPAGAHILKAIKTLAGTITPTGALTTIRKANIALAGSIAPAGALLKTAGKALAGSIGPTGALARSTSLAFQGATTPTGALAKTAQKPLSGSITPAGAYGPSTISKTLTGAVTPAGSLLKTIAKTLAGSIAPTGERIGKALLNFAGTTTPSGTVTTQISTGEFFESMAGTIAPVGDLLVKVSKTLAGATTPTGAITKTPSLNFAGTTTPSGTVANAVKILISLAGSIAPSGALAKSIAKTLAGTTTLSGALTKTIRKTLAGSIAPAATRTGKALLGFAGTISPTGALTTEKQTGGPFTVAVAGTIAPVGQLLLQIGKTLEGAAAPAGQTTLKARKTLTGSTTPAGTLQTAKTAVVALSGAITGLTGALTKRISKKLTSTTTPAGAITKSIAKSMAGAITPSGATTKTIRLQLAGTITLAGSVATQIFNVLSGPVTKLIRGQGRAQGIAHQGRTTRSIR